MKFSTSDTKGSDAGYPEAERGGQRSDGAGKW